MDIFLQDIRHGFRTLLKNPVLTAVGVLTLALGIGANRVIFNVIDATLLSPFPYESADRVVMAFETEPELPAAPVTPPDYLDWKEQNEVFQSMADGPWIPPISQGQVNRSAGSWHPFLQTFSRCSVPCRGWGDRSGRRRISPARTSL